MTVTQPAKRSAYTEWFTGDHKDVAPLATRKAGDPGPGHLNSPSGLITEIRDLREAVLALMDPDQWITRDDTFAVLLRLSDDLGEAIDELLAIGHPVERKNGTVVWHSDKSRPVAAAEAIAEECVVAELRNGVQGTLI